MRVVGFLKVCCAYCIRIRTSREGYMVKYSPLPVRVPIGEAGGNFHGRRDIFGRISRVESYYGQ